MTQNVQKIILQQLAQHPRQALVAVDGTLGNGFDLEFLAMQERISTIYGFDIQEEAIKKSGERVANSQKAIYLNHRSHAELDAVIKEPVDIVLFNLGYLPGGDKTCVTTQKTTLIAIKKALALLSDKGIMSIMTYPGHPEGAKEDEVIGKYLKTLHTKEWSILKLSVENVQKPCPQAYLIMKDVG